MLADASLVVPWMNELLSSPAAVRLGWVCVHTLWQGAAVAAVLAVALRLIPRRSPAALEARSILAAAALAALPLAAVATFLLVPAARPAAAVVSSRGDGDGAAQTLALARAGEAAPGDAGLALAPVPTMPAPAAAVHAPLMLERDQLARLAAWLPLVALAWTVGAVLAAARMACGWWVTRRLVARAAALADGRLQGRVDHWRRTMRIDAAVRILSSAAVEAPVVIGWLKPVILWPAAALVGMPAHELDAIVAHELAHVRRRDTLLNLLQACIDVLFFHHPAAWWISAQVRAEREHCADDLAVRALEAGRAGTRLSYARALLALEERRQTAALAVAATGGSLLDRIRRLAGADDEPAGPGRLLAAGLTAAAVVAIALSIAAPRQATAAELPEDTNKIESLTVEQARKLAEEFRGVGAIVKIKTLIKSSTVTLPNCLPLNSLKSLDAETARALADYGKGSPGHVSPSLLLSGLTALDADTANALAEFKGKQLVLTGLTTLDAEAAKALAQFEGRDLF
ncbi:MAG: M56 family metallopeptidase, partial [Planctomycetia bacterium]